MSSARGPVRRTLGSFSFCWSAALLAGVVLLASTSPSVVAAPAIEVLGRDFVFPNAIPGLPGKLGDFRDLQIQHFTTNDNVRLAYWEAGQGEPLIFVPGWSANGAEYVNVMSLLSKHYRVIVLDPRNQGLSQRVAFGTRIERFSMDLKQLIDHLGIKQTNLCGWSMGASVIWGYVDLFGTASIRKACFVDEPISIVGHPDWSEQERRDAGAIVSSPEQVLAGFAAPLPTPPQPSDTNLIARSLLRDSPYFANSEAFARAVIQNAPEFAALVMWDHTSHDWRDVLRHKIDVPTAIFTGDFSANVPSQRWARSVIPNARLYVYSKEQQGDHFLMFKNPVKFSEDLVQFLEE